MRNIIVSFILLLGFSSIACAQNDQQNHPKVSLQTNQGIIVIELDAEKAPVSVENFLTYVREGYYEGMIFHRVIKNFMIQGGGFDADFNKKETHAPIKNEATNGLSNKQGTLAMARTNDPHSASAQFFINTVDNDFLDHTSPTPRGWGYTVFGKVVEGMDVVEKIRSIPTSGSGPFPTDVPETPVIIEKALILDQKIDQTSEEKR